MNTSATIGDTGDPMITSSVCSYIFPLNLNTVEVRHSCAPSIMSSSGTFVLSSSSWSEMSSFLAASIAIFIGIRVKKEGKGKNGKKSTDANDSNCKQAGDALPSDVKDERLEGNSENSNGNEAEDRVISITQRLHIYLNDNDFIGFEILQKAVRTWHQSHKGFKNMIKSLLHLQNFQIHSVGTDPQPTLSLASTASLSSTASTLNIEALVANATRRNTIAYSTTAMNEDLQQLMSMFKPFQQNGITSTLEVSAYQTNKIDAILTEYLSKFDQWINRAKEIDEILSIRRQNCGKFNYLFDEHLYQLESILSPVYQNYPKCFPVKMCDKAIKVLEVLVSQVMLI
ncbi:unnamed protein product [Trichobilharzia regenti]|nr:unnamed protein product [Trichobilharzia regenti]